MERKILFFCFLFQTLILPQNNFIKQITSGDFDARNPFIYKDEFALNNNYLLFEIHSSGSTNIYYKTYNVNIGQFDDTIALTNNNYFNINPSYHPSMGMLYQTNQNGNWDIALIPDSNNIWRNVIFLTSSLIDETNPKYFEIRDDYTWGYTDSANIIFDREGSIIHLNYKNNIITEDEVFESDTHFVFKQYTAIENHSWWGTQGYFVFAIEEELSGVKRIVRNYKPYGGSYLSKTIIVDTCDCDDLELQYSNFLEWSLFYTDTLGGERRYFVLEAPFTNNPLLFNFQIPHSGDLSSYEVYMFFIVTKNGNILEPDLYWPHTYFLRQSGTNYVRFDISDLGFWETDSLYPVIISNSSLAIGSLGIENFENLIYTVWIDSINGHSHLFGTTQHMPFGSIEDESIANDFVLYQNYPNPFNPSTKIEYRLLRASDVKLNVFNVLGEKVFEQYFGYQTAGSYKIDFNGKNLPSGVYVYSIYTNENRLSRKMVLMK